MSMGEDLKEVLTDVGVSFNVVRNGVTVATEYLGYDSNRLITKPFFIEHQYNVELFYDTIVRSGDYIITSDGRKFYCVHLWPEIFENDIVSYGGVFFKLNATVDIQNPPVGGDGPNGARAWTPAYTAIPACLVWQNQGPHYDTEIAPLEGTTRRAYSCYIPKSYTVARSQRVIVNDYTRGIGPAGAMNLTVMAYDDWTYIGVTVLVLAEDARA